MENGGPKMQKDNRLFYKSFMWKIFPLPFFEARLIAVADHEKQGHSFLQ